MKDHFGTVDRPERYHQTISGTIAELNALAPIKERTRLIIGDMLSIVGAGSGEWSSAVAGDSILMSFSPVSHDTVGLQVYEDALTPEGPDPETASRLAAPWLEHAVALGVGTDDLDHIDLVEVHLD
jgi:hypothetical protein